MDYDLEVANNKRWVGTPETNIQIAHRVVDPEYVSKLEKEIKALRVLNTEKKESKALINKLVLEGKDKDKELQEYKESERERISEAFIKGQQSAKRVETMIEVVENKSEENKDTKYKNQIIELGKKCEQYKKKISGLERSYRALYKSALQYMETQILWNHEIPEGCTVDGLKSEIQEEKLIQELESKKQLKRAISEMLYDFEMTEKEVISTLGITEQEYKEIRKEMENDGSR